MIDSCCHSNIVVVADDVASKHLLAAIIIHFVHAKKPQRIDKNGDFVVLGFVFSV